MCKRNERRGIITSCIYVDLPLGKCNVSYSKPKYLGNINNNSNSYYLLCHVFYKHYLIHSLGTIVIPTYQMSKTEA